MEKIILKEDFDLVEVYDRLIESRGVIDNIDEIVIAVRNYINVVLSSQELKAKYFVGYDENEDVDMYDFVVPEGCFEKVDTLFMKEPIFNIHLFIMRNRFGDTERELGETNYEAKYYPEIREEGENVFLYKPSFNLSFVIQNVEKIDVNLVLDKLSHELVHAKRNLYEFSRSSKYREFILKKNAKTFDLLNGKEKTDLDEFIGMVLYLVSDDEINARSNQVYYQLKRFSFLTRENINKAIEMTKIHGFIKQIDEKIEVITKMEEKQSYYESNYIYKVLRDVYRKKDIKDNPYEFLINLLITQKNRFIRQIDKVKERVLYEKEREPIIMK